MRRAFIALGVMALLGSASTARAQGNYRTAPLGGRSALMGGTGIAAGHDGAAPFLNPATIANVPDTGFAFSANFLQVRSVSVPQFHRPGAVDPSFGNLALDETSLTTTEVDLLPSTLCLFVNLGGKNEQGRSGHRVSFCFGTLERDAQSKLAIGYRGGSNAVRVDQGQSFLRKWNRFSIGPAYSVNITDELAVGAGLSMLATNFDQLSSGNTSIYSPDGQFLATAIDSVASATSIDVNGSIGFTYKVDANYQLGLSVTVPTLHLLGNYSSLYQTQYSGSVDSAYAQRGEGAFRASMPAKLGAGIAGNLNDVRFELDAAVSFPRNKATEAKLSVDELLAVSGRRASERTYELTFDSNLQPVVNTGVGIEWFFKPRLGLLLGASSDFTAVPPLSEEPKIGTIAFSRMNRASASLGIGSYGKNTELVVGVEMSHMWGKTFVLNPFEIPNRLVPVEQSGWGFVLVVAGATNLNALKATVENVENIVKAGPKK